MNRVLIIQPLVSFYKTDMSVSVPILNSLDIETVVLPVSFSVCNNDRGVELTSKFSDFLDFSRENKIHFDCVFISGLFSEQQLSSINNLLDDFNDKKDLLVIFNSNSFPKNSSSEYYNLCNKSNIFITNENINNKKVLENNLIFDWLIIKDCNVSDSKKCCRIIEKKSNMQNISIGFGETNESDDKKIYYKSYPEEFRGNNDIFASVVTGAILKGIPVEDSVRLALNFLNEAVEKTLSKPDYNWYGADFESVLSQLKTMVKNIL